MSKIKIIIWITLIAIIGILTAREFANAEEFLYEETSGGEACLLDNYGLAETSHTFDKTYYMNQISINMGVQKMDQEMEDAYLRILDESLTTLYGVPIPFSELDDTTSNYWRTSIPDILIEEGKPYIVRVESSESNNKNAYYTFNNLLGSDYTICNETVIEANMNMIIRGTVLEPVVFRPWLIETAFASECTFVTNGATTTSECTDPIITSNNPATNVFLNYMLFLIFTIFTFVLWIKLKQKGGD